MPRSIRAAALAEARRWIGTPYHHRASTPGVGCDCLGLICGIWRKLYGENACDLPAYTPDWSGPEAAEDLLAGLRRHLVELSPGEARPGDILLFRPARNEPGRHCGILSDHGCFIHAYWRRTVCETRLTSWWRRRCVAAFRFPASEKRRNRIH